MARVTIVVTDFLVFLPWIMSAPPRGTIGAHPRGTTKHLQLIRMKNIWDVSECWRVHKFGSQQRTINHWRFRAFRQWTDWRWPLRQFQDNLRITSFETDRVLSSKHLPFINWITAQRHLWHLDRTRSCAQILCDPRVTFQRFFH